MRSEDQDSGQSAEAGVYRMATHLALCSSAHPRGSLSYVLGVRGLLSSLHLLSASSAAPGVGEGGQALVLPASSLCPPLSEGPDGVLGGDARAGCSVPHLQPGGHLVPSGLLCLSAWPDDLPVIGDDLGVGV